MSETNSTTEAHRALDGGNGFASYLQGALDRFDAYYHPVLGQIEVTLRSSHTGALRNGMVITLTPAGWRAVFDVVRAVEPAAKLTADEICWAATILERISADFQYQTPGMGEWSADRLRYEADKCYSPTSVGDLDGQVTA